MGSSIQVEIKKREKSIEMACLEGRNSFAIYKFHEVTKFRETLYSIYSLYSDSLERRYIPKTMLVVRLSFQGTCKKKKLEVSKMKYFLEN